MSLKELVAAAERDIIIEALNLHDNHISNTAKELQLERSHLYKKMKAGEIVAYFGRLKGMRGAEAKQRARHLLEKYGLGDWVDKRCETLSKGMGQKVQLLGTLIHDPDLVILDASGKLRREWRKVKVDGHAEDVLAAARELNRE